MSGPDPRPSNHGGHTPSTPHPLTPPTPRLTSRFDWYAFTLDGSDDGRVPAALSLALGATISAGKGRLGYARAQVVQRGDDVLATVLGHSARAGEAHVIVTGSACDEVVPVVRRLWPAHRVARADSAVDFAADFDRLDARVLAFAQARGISFRLVTNSAGGATRYLGAASSEVRVRAYKKSEEQLALHPERALEIPAGIVRLEVQVRPSKRAVKEAAATLHPDDLWGFGGWARDLAADVLALDALRTITHFRRPSDWSRSLHWLGVQYGPLVARRAAEVGHERAVAEVLGALGLA